MQESQFYVRSRGKVAGPFEMSTLLKLVRRGMYSAIDEVSTDRKVWSRASDFEELFPRRKAAASSQKDNGSAPYETNPSDEILLAPVQTEPVATDNYFYQQGGVTVGPVNIRILQSLAENGTITQQDMVWKDGATSIMAAGQLTALAPIFFGKSRTEPSLNGAQSFTGNTGVSAKGIAPSMILLIKQRMSRTSSIVTFTGIFLAIMLLAVIHLPWLTVGGNVYGWWTVFHNLQSTPDSQPDAGKLLLNVLVLSLSAVALLLIIPLMHGLSRGITCICIGGIGAIYYIFFLVSSPLASDILLMFASLYLIPIFSSGLASLLRARATVAGTYSRSVIVGIFSGLIGLLSLIVVIAALSHVVSQANYGGMLVGSIIFVIAQLLVLTSSVLGFVGLKPVYSPGLNLATILCARIGTFLIILSLSIMVLDIGYSASWFGYYSPYGTGSGAAQDSRFWITIYLFRFLFIAIFYPAIAILGLGELADILVIQPVVQEAK